MSFFEPRNIGWARVATFLLALVVFAAAAPARAQQLDEMSLDRWKKLRETERYQMQVADNYYRDRNFKVALSEYEKFLSLYEKSEGSSSLQVTSSALPSDKLNWNQFQPSYGEIACQPGSGEGGRGGVGGCGLATLIVIS